MKSEEEEFRTGKEPETTSFLQGNDDTAKGAAQAERESIKIETDVPKRYIEYGLTDRPAWQITLFYSFQQICAILPGPLTAVYILQEILCLEGEQATVIQSKLFSTSIFMIGLATLIQCTIGVRLPIVQGSTVSFLVPYLALLETKTWKCPSLDWQQEANITLYSENNSTAIGLEAVWSSRLRELSGCLMCASCVELVLGGLGIVGVILRFLGPLTMASTLSLLAISLTRPFAKGAAQHWGIACFTMIQIILFTVLLGQVQVPCITYNRTSGFKLTRFKLFKLFPVLCAVFFSWILSFILTKTNMLPDTPEEVGYLARTDAKLYVITEASWFYIPYPGQWGTPTVTSFGALFGLLGATVATVLESITDYYATSRVTMAPMPPKHAMNRGIMMEGVSCFLSGFIGACHPTTSYSSVIGFIALTGVASRIVWQTMGVICLLLGIFGKFGAIITAIPTPIIAGAGVVSVSMLLGAGISVLQFVDMNSPRNLLIIGFSHMIGIMIPNWLQSNPEAIKTGSEDFDQILTVFLSTSMCVGGLIALLLDNILPGSEQERGLVAFREVKGHAEREEIDSLTNPKVDVTIFDLPLISRHIKNIAFFKYVPFLPSYQEPDLNCSKKSKLKETTI